jgi:cyanophycinase
VLSRAALLAALLLLLLLPAAFAADPAATAMPQLSAGLAAGSLVIVGGGAPLPDAVRDRFLELAGGKNARLVVIPTASNKADQPQLLKTPQYWKAQHVASVVVLHTHSREQANDPAFVKPLTEATGVWLTGGVQSRLIDTYRGTLVERELRNVLARGGVIGGTSAGAAVMSPVMIVGGNPHAVVGSGFGFLSGVVVDQHFQNRHRLNRLLEVLGKFPQYPGLGIDERTAIVVTGHSVTVMGNGEVRACLSAVAQQAASVQVHKPGDRFDLLELCRSALAHVPPAPGNGKPASPGLGRAAASP